MRIVLLVDTDLGFTFWLGHLLDRAGYAAFPARSVPDALTLVSEMELTVDMLAINPSLPSAESLVAALRQMNAALKVVAIVGEHEPVGVLTVPGVDAVQNKPEVIDGVAELEWLHLVKSMFAGNPVAG